MKPMKGQEIFLPYLLGLYDGVKKKNGLKVGGRCTADPKRKIMPTV